MLDSKSKSLTLRITQEMWDDLRNISEDEGYSVEKISREAIQDRIDSWAEDNDYEADYPR